MNPASKRTDGQRLPRANRQRPQGALPGRCLFTLIFCAMLLAAPGLARPAGFALQDLQGRTLRLGDYHGKWVLVNFWATWCTPCLDEIPELVSLHAAHRDKDLSVIGIAVDSGSQGKIAEFAAAHGINYPVVIGNPAVNAQFGPLEALPASYLYDPAGKLQNLQTGKVTRARIEAIMKGH
jgi:thiol-disulfide isomerase/thioredoxin